MLFKFLNFNFAFNFKVLIDKDNSPKWNPSTLSEVTEQQVESYFQAPANKDFKELQL